MVGISIPTFFFGLICILIFSIKLKWLPAGGRIYPGYDSLFDTLPHLIMPALVLSLTQTAGVMRYARSSMLDAMGKPYINTARSKGLTERRVNYLHGFRGALTPIVVLVGFRLPTLIGGSVVIETVFQWPGLGNEFVAAVKTQNTPMVMMIAFFSVLAVLVASLLIDIITALLDPRIRLS
jgi:peptide/nickel transport system permease protein